jgi:hypothetical protein
MTTIIRIALTIAIAGATYAACDRHADASECAPLACPFGELCA